MPLCGSMQDAGIRSKCRILLQRGASMKTGLFCVVLCLSLSLLLAACATAPPAPDPTPDIPATVTAEVDSQLAQSPTSTPWPTHTPYPTPTRLPTATPYPTNTPYPTATARPTYTPYPMSTPLPTLEPLPTYTPYPTATARPTYTPYPTATATPRPTRTPLPTITPTPSVRWGVANTPVTITQLAASNRIRTDPFILSACYAGISGTDSGKKSFTFTVDGRSNRSSRYAEVTGFAGNTVLSSNGCYEMAVKFVRAVEYCYYTSFITLWGCPDNSWDYNTPIFRLLEEDSFSVRSRSVRGR